MLKKLKTFILANKATVVAGSIATILFFVFVFQYTNYHFFNSADNAELAVKNGQRVVVDLNEQILPSKALDDTKNSQEKNTDKVEFAAKDGEKAAAVDDGKKVVSAAPAEPNVEIAIIIANLGLNEEALRRISIMSKDFTLAYSPYGQLSTKSSIAMTEEGFAVLAELPMESTVTREDAGRFGLSSLNSEFKNKQNFEAILSIVPSAVGVLTPSVEDFSGQPRFEELLKMVLAKDLGLVYFGQSQKKVKEFAALNGLEAAYPDLTIDEMATPENIQAQLNALELLAQENGFAVGIARPYPITLDALDEWQKTLAKKKIVLIPAISR